MNLKLRLLIPLLSVSCAVFVNRFDQNRLTQEISTYKPTGKTLFCAEKSPLQLVNSNLEIQQAFEKFLAQVESALPLKYVDKAVLWSLVQMNLRPDQASPTAKLQAFIKVGGESRYFHFYSKQDEAFPYLAGLETLLSAYNSKNSLLSLAKQIDSRFPNSFFMGEGFEKFLTEHKKKIAEHPVLKEYYMRGDETLKENEKIHKYKLAPLISEYLRQKKNHEYEAGSSLFSYQSDRDLIAHCNYDMRLYSNSIYLIHKDFIKSHLFGLSIGKNSFLASASQRLEKFEPVGKSLFFKGVSQTRSAAFCSFEFPNNKNKNLWMVSSESRDPGQHIYHFMQYGLKSMESVEEISELVGFSRHLFLEDPTRLVFESHRSSKEQLERLLKLNLPVYNARQLGSVWAMFQDQNESAFVIDERTDGKITCSKK